MAYTKIIPIRNRLDRCINYALNEKKTDLKNAVFYILNPDKTNSEHIVFESSINCIKDTAIADMKHTKKVYGKESGIQGYHIIQSFMPGEIDAKTAHHLGYQFAKQCFGSDFEAIVATHLDRGHMHNHIVINSVSFRDGHKFTNTFTDYYKDIRGLSDQLCESYGLSVISPDIENRSLTYNEWLAIYKGKASWNTIIKNDIDTTIARAPSYGAFLVLMEHQGYEIKEGQYLAFRPMGMERFSRGYKLGKAYSQEAIKARIDGIEILEELPVSYTPKRRRYIKVPMPDVLRVYWRYMYLLGKVKKNQAPPRMSAYLKQELSKFESYKAQFRFIHAHGLYSEADINAFVSSHHTEITSLYESLSKLKKQFQAKGPCFSALSDKTMYKQAHHLFQSGYTMMAEESDKYLKAVSKLKKNGYVSEADLELLLGEKITLTSEMDTIKSKINSLKKEIRQCEQITASLPKIKENIETKQEKTKERTGDLIDRY